MRYLYFGSLIGVTAVILACDHPAQIDEEREALLRTDQEWASVVGTGDVDKIISYWAEDAIVLPPDTPMLIGKQAIREYVAESLKIPGFSITWKAKQAVLAATGDMGYTVATNRITMTSADGAAVVAVGKAVTIWRKEADGKWRCVVDIWSADSPTMADSVGAGP